MADEQSKQRIITHMNRDHPRELSLYLRHYAGLSSGASANPTLRDMSLQAMVIQARGIDYSVPLSPPLASWREARERLVAMDAEARAALGVSDIVINEWVSPGPLIGFVIVGVSAFFASAASLPWMHPGSGLWEVLETVWPLGAANYRWIIVTGFWPILGIHIVEAIYFAQTYLPKYRVQRGSSVWMKWVLTCFLAGLPTFSQFNKLVEEKKKQKEAKQH